MFDIMRIPSILENTRSVKATVPTKTPHTTLSHSLGSGLSGEIPLEQSPLIADVLESAAVT